MMTQTRTPRFTVAVMSPKGGPTLKEFSNLPGQEGIPGGIAASAHPKHYCDTLDFDGVRDLVGLVSGEVVQAHIRDGAGVHPVFFGAIVVGDTDEPDEGLVPYQASARILLLATACRSDRYRAQDTATIAFDLVSKYRHPSLKARPQDFPPSGTVLDTFAAKGQLADVLDELLELTENTDYGAGLDPEGYVFFRPNALQVTVDYAETDYQDKPTSGNAISTATLWSFDEPPGITPWAGSYVPKPRLHLSVPEAALHERYGYERVRPVPQSAITLVNLAAYTQAGFTNPQNAVTQGATTPAERTGTSTSNFTLLNDDPEVVGVQLLYRRDDAVGPVLFRATAGGVYYEVELPKSDGAMKPLPLPLPPHESGFVKWDTFKITVPAGGTFQLQEFYPLRLETGRLDAASRAVVPERLPGQIAQRGIQPNAATVRLKGAPRGQRDIPSAGLRWSWTPGAGPETVTDLEVSAYDLDPAKTQAVSGYYRTPRS
jgi:hypothetical protein